ncbi:MAG: glycosyltransferase [Candidatus Micrarchaeia archaeon]
MTLKIGFISDAVFPWHVGGLEKTEALVAKELAKNNNYKVEFVCCQWPGMQKKFEYNNITYNTIMNVNNDQFYKHQRRSILNSIKYALNLFKIFKYRYDILIVNFFPIVHIPIIKFYSKITKAKIILDVAEVWDKNYWIEYLGRFFGTISYKYMKISLKMADAYIVNSSITAQKAIDEGVDFKKIQVFSPIIDIKMMNNISKSINKRDKKIIYAARFIKEKRFDKFIYLVDAFHKKYNKEKFNAVLIGTGPEEDNINELINELNLKKIIKVKKPYENINDLYKEIASSYLTYIPSEREGLSALAIESIALNTPVLLPSETPIPNEVKNMCIVELEENMVELLKKIFKSKNPSVFINNKENLKMFEISRINNVYSELFKNLLTNK